MATIVSCRTHREVSLAMSPPKVVEDDDSPHLNTLRVVNEKAKESELPGPGMTFEVDNDPGDDESDESDDNGNGDKQIGIAEDESDKMNEGMPDNSSSDDDLPSYLPAHLDESNAPNNDSPIKDDDEGVQTSSEVPTQGEASVSQDQPNERACACGANATADQVTPTGNIHRRIPSSSIPHLLSSSNNLSADALLIQQQMLASPLRSREESFAFSVDGDDSAYKGLMPTSPRIVPTINPQAHIVLEACGSTLSSSASVASFISHKSQNVQFSVSVTPPNPPNFYLSPPQRVTLPSNIQGAQTPGGLDMPQLSQPPSSAISPADSSLNLHERACADVARIQAAKQVLEGAGQTCGLPLPSQQQLLLTSTQYPPPSSSGVQPVQPVLYSAINSLERYNAASFDNKVMLAKARGTYGKQKAFPGVPNKDVKQKGDGVLGSLGSRLDSKSSSVTSTAGQRKGSQIDKDAIKQKKTEGTNRQMDQKGEELLVPTKQQPSEGSTSRIYKSRSSGNLSQKEIGVRPESLEELKAGGRRGNKAVTINEEKLTSTRRGKRREKKVGVFRPSSDAYTPRMGNRAIKYKPAQERASVEKISSTMGTIQRPNFRDALRRVAIILHQHIVKIERRFSTGMRGVDDTGLFKASMRDQFNEDNFATPRYKCSMVRVPMARPGVVYSMRQIQVNYETPTTDEIYEFAHQLFKKVQLSSECSIVCLIYVEKLMEVAKVPLVAETWRPIFMCGLLLASKVWQDLSSWNIEFASVYPQFSLDAINRLELSFLKFIKWDLYISSSLYAKYYFALRSLLEKSGFRDRYNQMVGGIGGIAASEAAKVAKRSEAVKEEALLQLSRSLPS